MKKRFLSLCLAACMLTGLAGCGGTADDLMNSVLKEEDETFVTGQQYKDEAAAITMEYAALSDCTMAPLTLEDDGSVNAYYASDDENSDEEGDYLYLDCVSTVKNVGSEELDLEDDLYFYCADENDMYDDYMVFVESADGTTLDDAGELQKGKTARVHYTLVLPEDISWTQLKVYFIMPESSTTYAAPLSDCKPNAQAFSADTPVKTAGGAVLTMKSCTVADEAASLTDAGGNTSIQPITDGDKLVDIAIEVTNNGSEALTLGTLYGGQMLEDGFNSLGTVVLEAGNDMVYSGSIASGSTVMTHLLFELAEDPTEGQSFYLYADGMFYSIAVNAAK